MKLYLTERRTYLQVDMSYVSDNMSLTINTYQDRVSSMIHYIEEVENCQTYHILYDITAAVEVASLFFYF